MGAESFLTLQIVDFAEGVDDRVAALLQAGTGITLTYNDGAGTLTITNTGLGGSTGATDNRILRADGTGGSTVQATNIEIDDSNLVRQPISQTDVSITSGTGDAWRVNNSGTQTKVTFAFGGTIRGGYRVDSSGNFNWHSTGTQGHQFYHGSGNNQGFNGDGLVVNCQAGGATAIQGISLFGSIGFRGGSNTSNSNDVQIVRNSTGPTVETRAAGGLRVRTLDGSAAGALDCGAITASGLIRQTSSAGMQFPSTGYGPFWQVSTTLNNLADGILGLRNFAETSGIAFDVATTNGTLRLRDRTNSAAGALDCGAIVSSALVTVGTYTVATLPSAAANAGALAQVTDSSVTTNGSAVSGGGSNRVVVFSNGSTWDVVVA